jgi:hypothetical protein
MEKTLVYHLYMKDDYFNNVAYWVHLICLKRYIGLFDKVKFTIAVDDLSRHDIIKNGYEFINSLEASCETHITVMKNGELGETETFKREILDMNNDGMVFFAHSKGVGRIIDGKINSSVLLWVLLLYYQNLTNVETVEKNFLDMPLRQGVFYGGLLIGSIRNEPLTRAFGMHYSGNFFWINMPKYKNWRTIGRIPVMEPDGRWFTEIYPGLVCNFEMMGGGMETYNKEWFEMEDVQTYKMSRNDWDYIFTVYDIKENMNDFIEEIYNLIGVDNIDFENKTEWDDKI